MRKDLFTRAPVRCRDGEPTRFLPALSSVVLLAFSPGRFHTSGPKTSPNASTITVGVTVRSDERVCGVRRQFTRIRVAS